MLADGVLNNKKVVVTSDRKNYWRYYGLRFDPFAALPKESLGYLTSNREQQFDILHYLCRSSNVLITIIGNKGIGKSMLIKQFVAQTDDTITIQQLLGSKHLGLAQLVDVIENGFSVSSANEENEEDKLDSLLTQLQQQKKLCLLVIDDAHLLPADSLKALMYFVKQQSESQMQLHIILLGQPQLKENLNQLCDSPVDHEIIHSIDLLPLSLEETQGYIKHRLHNAGLPAAIPLSHYAITRIHKLSQGIPERINVIAKQYLIEAMQQKQLNSISSFMENHRTEVIGGSIIAVILFTIATLWSHGSHYPVIPSWSIFSTDHIKTYNPSTIATVTEDNLSKNSSNHASNSGINPTAQIPKSNGSVSSFSTSSTVLPINSTNFIAVNTISAKSQQINSQAALTVNSTKPTTTLNSTDINSSAAKSTTVATSNETNTSPILNHTLLANKFIATINQSASHAPVAAAASNSHTPTTAPATHIIASAPNVKNSAVAVSTPAESMTTSSSNDPFNAVTQDKQNELGSTLETVQSDVLQNVQVAVATTSAQTTKANTSSTPIIAKNESADTQALLAMDASHFTLQLIGVSNEASLKHFIAVNRLGNQAKYFRSTLNGKNWYVLLYGNFANKADANAAIKALPTAVLSQHPWVRAVSSVQSSIHKQQMMLTSNANTQER